MVLTISIDTVIVRILFTSYLLNSAIHSILSDDE